MKEVVVNCKILHEGKDAVLFLDEKVDNGSEKGSYYSGKVNLFNWKNSGEYFYQSFTVYKTVYRYRDCSDSSTPYINAYPKGRNEFTIEIVYDEVRGLCSSSIPHIIKNMHDLLNHI